MKLNTIIQLPDGRIGTICWNHLDGAGGVWGRHHFEMPEMGFGDDLPAPQFMLRTDKGNLALLLRRAGHREDLELVGEEIDVLDPPPPGHTPGGACYSFLMYVG